MARNSAQNRRLDVLRAIVTQYVATREPVDSKAIAAGGLGVSSATIRKRASSTSRTPPLAGSRPIAATAFSSTASPSSSP